MIIPVLLAALLAMVVVFARTGSVLMAVGGVVGVLVAIVSVLWQLESLPVRCAAKKLRSEGPSKYAWWVRLSTDSVVVGQDNEAALAVPWQVAHRMDRAGPLIKMAGVAASHLCCRHIA